MGRKYLRIFWEELGLSEGWKKLAPGERAEALRRLLASVQEGQGVPASWKRVAELRTIGEKGVPKTPRPAVPERFQPFKATWDRLWEEARGFPYVWDGKQKAGLYRAHQKAAGALPPFEARCRKLLTAQKDAWMIDNASPCLIDSKWNELGVGLNGHKQEVCVRCGTARSDRLELIKSSIGLICFKCWK